MIKRTLITTIIAVVVVSLTVVAIANYRRAFRPAIARDPANTTDTGKVGTLEPDRFIAAEKAPAAPEFAKGSWIHADELTLEKLRGRVVLVEFWTFGCYNCRNTLPSVKEWYSRYRDRGLTIVGVHTPETDREYNLESVRRESKSLGLEYPVVTDNDYQTWNAYRVEAWPTLFVLDKKGRIRWLHVGEGRYEETEGVIKVLIAEN